MVRPRGGGYQTVCRRDSRQSDGSAGARSPVRATGDGGGAEPAHRVAAAPGHNPVPAYGAGATAGDPARSGGRHDGPRRRPYFCHASTVGGKRLVR